MLDDVAIWPFLEQPSRKCPVPAVVAMLQHEQLDERALFLWHFPLGSPLTGTQAHNRPADADALAGLERDFANQAIALIQQAQHSNALGHRRHPRHRRIIGLNRQFRRSGGRWRRRGTFPLARGKRQ
jgi:hypothetical protein